MQTSSSKLEWTKLRSYEKFVSRTLTSRVFEALNFLQWNSLRKVERQLSHACSINSLDNIKWIYKQMFTGFEWNFALRNLKNTFQILLIEIWRKFRETFHSNRMENHSVWAKSHSESSTKCFHSEWSADLIHFIAAWITSFLWTSRLARMDEEPRLRFKWNIHSCDVVEVFSLSAGVNVHLSVNEIFPQEIYRIPRLVFLICSMSVSSHLRLFTQDHKLKSSQLIRSAEKQKKERRVEGNPSRNSTKIFRRIHLYYLPAQSAVTNAGKSHGRIAAASAATFGGVYICENRIYDGGS